MFNSVSRIKSVQFCGSYSQKCVIFKKFCEFFFKRFNGEKTLSPEKKGFNSVHFFESKVFKKVQVFESPKKKRFNYLSHVKKSSIMSCEKGPSIGVMKKGRNNSFSQIEQKRKFNSLSHIFNKKSSIL